MAVELQQLPSENDGRRPHVGPVRKTLVLDEIFLANEIVGVGGLQDAIGVIIDNCFLDLSPEAPGEREHECITVQNGAFALVRKRSLVDHSENADVSSRL